MPISAAKKEYLRNYRRRNKEKIKAKAALWQAAHREKMLVSRRQWREKNPEHCKEYAANYWQDNKERCVAVKKTWREKNPDKVKFTKRKVKAKKIYGEYWPAQLTKMEIIKCLNQQN